MARKPKQATPTPDTAATPVPGVTVLAPRPKLPPRAERYRAPRAMVSVTVAPGFVVLGPKGSQTLAGETLDVPAALVAKTPQLAAK